MKPWSHDWLIAAGAYPGFCSTKRLGVFLDGMLDHRRSHPHNLLGFPNKSQVPIYQYTWVERGTVRVKCLAQEHNTMFPARTRTRTAHFGDERTNHEATAPPRIQSNSMFYSREVLAGVWVQRQWEVCESCVPSKREREREKKALGS